MQIFVCLSPAPPLLIGSSLSAPIFRAILFWSKTFNNKAYLSLSKQQQTKTTMGMFGKKDDVSKGECLKLAATLKKVSDLPVSCRQYDDVVKIVEDNMNPYAGADRSVVSEAKIQRRLTTRRLTKKKDRFE